MILSRQRVWLVMVLAAASLARTAMADDLVWQKTDYGWLFTNDFPPTSVCVARLPGPLMNTQVLLNNYNQVLVTLGNPDWNVTTGMFDVSVSIDGGSAITMNSGGFLHSIFVLLKDSATETRFRHAHKLHWHLPVGDYTVVVDGIDRAVRDIRACKKP